MAYSTVTWANRNVPTLEKFNQMGANTAHLLVEMEALPIAHLANLSTNVWSTVIDLGIRIDSHTVGYVEEVAPLAPAEYVVANRDISDIAVGLHTLNVNNVVFKFWKPDGMNLLTAWFRTRGIMIISWGTVMIHRTPMVI
jgi:hypothetical protein